MPRLVKFLLVAIAALVAAPVTANAADTARYILPPGNFGGLPTTANSLDQLPLYDALTPLRGNVDRRTNQRLFLPENFEPIGASHVEQTGRPGLRSSTTTTASRTSTARRAPTWPSARVGRPRATAAC